MERERFCLCRGLSLPFLEGILLHRYICQGNKDSPPGAVCQGRESHTDNLLLQSLLEQPWEEVMLLAPLLAADQWVGLVRLD